jgi:release factor glutamine methyltransferase
VHRLARPLILARIARPSEVTFAGLRLRTDPNVFHPLLFSSSSVLVRRVLARAGPLRGRRVLDMGTGAGPLAVKAASLGANVTACDVNPRAVALASENCALNGVQAEVLESDLFAALAGRAFDLICFNVPFYARDAATPLQAAFCAGSGLETIRRFASGCAKHLTPGGRVVIVFSEDCDERTMVGAFEHAGVSVESRTRDCKLLEYFHVVWFRRER